MTTAIKRFPPDKPVANIVEEIKQSGVTIIENLFTSDAIDSLSAKLNPRLEAQKPGGGEFFGNRKRSVGGLFWLGHEFS